MQSERFSHRRVLDRTNQRGFAFELIELFRTRPAPRCRTARLSDGLEISRQAYIRACWSARAHSHGKRGALVPFELDARPLEQARDYLTQVACQWDEALARLKKFVE